jgi:hypothetical protein
MQHSIFDIIQSQRERNSIDLSTKHGHPSERSALSGESSQKLLKKILEKNVQTKRKKKQ